MKKSLFQLALMLFLSSILLTCNREETIEPQNDQLFLTTNGEQFMKQLKANPEWELIWGKLNENGLPLVNNALINNTPNHGLHYLVPILNSNKIVDRFAIFPLDVTPDNIKGIIPLKRPLIVDEASFKNDLILKSFFEIYVLGTLKENNIELDSTFIMGKEELLSRLGNLKTIMYRVHFISNGHTIDNPWEKDIGYLISLLETYERCMKNCPYKHYIIIKSDYLEFIFYDIPDYAHESTVYNYLNNFTETLVHQIPEVVIPANWHWSGLISYKPPTYDLPNGIYTLDPLQPLAHKIHSLLPPSPPPNIPGGKYMPRTGQKFYKEGPPPPSGRRDRSNKKCVAHSIEYVLKRLGTSDDSAEKIYRKYQTIPSVWIHSGVSIDKNFPKLLTFYFELDPIWNNHYQPPIDNGEPIIGFLPSNMRLPNPRELHCVIIVGYNTIDGWLIYYNPTTGDLHEAPAGYFIRSDVSFGLKKRNI